MSNRDEQRAAMRAVRKQTLKILRNAPAVAPTIRVRWWYRPAVGFLTWYWAITKRPMNGKLLGLLVRHGHVIERAS